MTDPDLALATRAGLPDALRVLLDAYPRTGWSAHAHFTGHVQFWLERHLMFRKLFQALTTDTEAMLDRQIEVPTYGARLSRYGGLLVNELHTHHHVEDSHYFPILKTLDARLIRGFEMLDTDHHAMDALINGFTDAANGVLGALDQPEAAHAAAGTLHDVLGQFHRALDRHLTDEEEIIVPVILDNEGRGLH